MNIFALSNNPQEAAQMLCNKHVGKMLVESAQIICSAMFLLGQEKTPYKPTHLKHPCVSWTASAPENMKWLYEHALELCKENFKRYGKMHKTQDVVLALRVPDCDSREHNPFVLAMPDKYKSSDAIQSYRNYYIGEKSKFAKWEPKTQVPYWWPR